MRLNDLAPALGAVRQKKRVGRGAGSGQGMTSGKGHKGQKARSGAHIKPGFEGGQTPLYRRLPQRKGFRNVNRVCYIVVNLDDLERFDAGSVVDIETLVNAGLLGSSKDLIKVLGDGELTKSLTVKANKFSKTAEQKIVAAGGTVEVI